MTFNREFQPTVINLRASFRRFRSARILSWLSIMTRGVGNVQSARSPLNDCLKAAVNRGQVSQCIRKMGIDLTIPTPSNHLLNSPESSWHDEASRDISFPTERIRFRNTLSQFSPSFYTSPCKFLSFLATVYRC